MSDFSQHGGIAPEWELLVESQPQLTFPLNITAIELRQLTNDSRAQAAQKLIAGVDTVHKKDFALGVGSEDSITLRVYKRMTAKPEPGKLPIYIWYHGGGFLFGSLDGEDGHCFNMVQKLDVIVVHVCYRHTPEYPWPVPRQDALAGFNWVFDHVDELGGDPNKVIVSGRSAGGLLAAIVAIQDREQHGKNRIQGQILDIPVLCHSANFPAHLILPGKGSYEENRLAPLLPVTRLDLFESLLGENASTDRLYNVLLLEDESLKGSPTTHFQIAGRDILRDQSFLFMDKLQRLGYEN
ncbi:uncharacterized protein A1O9_08346 [Exophiala aquamarina CBS 119918]|uniref:Alpha/beta hydrolase fold-3 domain-containing protein n=1 Tax=Exophiala aquamarina CBS 119918 TaxID=1182545 RepID=A0A072P6V7_9EURO|nr:uncharacterized protein A1O9_08346 [Exophiala aquamarina CBS 119918]KEF55596.1 hypothetical protein A1O9_08346 [Exophiala aquamarina CBS 119918]